MIVVPSSSAPAGGAREAAAAAMALEGTVLSLWRRDSTGLQDAASNDLTEQQDVLVDNLNEAEKVCDRMWAAARVLLLHTGQSDTLMYKAVSYAMYVDLRMATGPSRGWLTPYGMIKGVQPSDSGRPTKSAKRP